MLTFVTGDSADDVRAAYESQNLVHQNLTEAFAQANALLSSCSLEARAVAKWTIGKVRFEQGNLPAARASMRDAIRTCRRAHLDSLEGAVWLSLAAVLVEMGNAAQSLDALRRAEPLVRGIEVGRLEQQRLYVLLDLGEWSEALTAAERALPLIRSLNDRVGEARLIVLRGLCHLGSGGHVAAIADFKVARRLADRIGERLISALSQQNLGCAYGRLGDIPKALACFEQARLAYRQHGEATRLLTILDTDLAETLLLAGLPTEAVEAAARSADLASAAGNVVNEGDARLMLARALLLDRRFAEAERSAHNAAALFRRSRRAGWALLAEYVELQAVVDSSQNDACPPLSLLNRARRVADRLADQGWLTESCHVRTYVARIALARGDRVLAEAQLADVVTATHKGPVAARANAYHAVALTHLARSDTKAALRAVRSGLALVDRFRSVLGATDLRSAVAVHGLELARLGLRIAISNKQPEAIFEWSERWRAVSLRMPTIKPPEDVELAELLARLRYLHVVRIQGSNDQLTDGTIDTAIARVEADIAHRVRQTDPQRGATYRSPSLRKLSSHLGDSVMLLYTELDGELWLQRVEQQRWEIQSLGRLDAVQSEIAYLTSAIRRLLAFKSLPDLEVDAHAAVQLAADRVDTLLLGSTTLKAADLQQIVLVPSGGLIGVVWPALPSLEDRDVVLTPSVTFWHEQHASRALPETRTRVSLVAGPDLPAAQTELDALRRIHPMSTMLRDRRASVNAALKAFETADLIHVAAHGTFRKDSPLFSSFRMANGPVTVYDIERLSQVPRSIVLSSCSGGTVGVRPGDELMGAAVAFLRLGTRTLIAPIDAVDDDLTAALMKLIHRHIATGSTLSAALSRSQTETKKLGRRAWANSCLFLALGH